MSGGELDYIYLKVNGCANKIMTYGIQEKEPLYRAFALHLHSICDALHHIEWAMSGDESTQAAYVSIKKIIAPTHELATLLIEEANVACKNLNDLLSECK